MDFRAVLYAAGVVLLIATLVVKTLATAVVGGAFMLAAIIYGWFRNQEAKREMVRKSRRENPNGARRRPYYVA